MNSKITKKTTLKKILEIKGSEKKLAKHRLPCLHCPMAKYEIEKLEIGKVAEMYNLDLEKILDDLNKK